MHLLLYFKIISDAGNTQTIHVKLVDFGALRMTGISDIGYLDQNFTKFPAQSVSLCLLNLCPWNQREWNDDDTRCVTKLLCIDTTDKLRNQFEMNVQFVLQPDLIFTSNLNSSGLDYVEQVISKGIARKNISMDFIRYINEMKKN